MDSCQGQKRRKAGRKALPADHQAAILLLEPGKRMLSLEPGHRLFNGSAAGFLGLPDALGNLRPNATPPEPLPQGFRIVSFIGGKDFETFAGAAPGARPHLDRIKQRHPYGQNIRTRLPMGDDASTITGAWACLLLHSHPYSASIGTAKAEGEGDGLETPAGVYHRDR